MTYTVSIPSHKSDLNQSLPAESLVLYYLRPWIPRNTRRIVMDANMPRQKRPRWSGWWLRLPGVMALARILCRDEVLKNEYLRVENKILKAKVAAQASKASKSKSAK